jgi:arylsulfatase
MSFYLKDGVPIFDYNYFDDHSVIKGDKPVPDGESTIDVAFDYVGGGHGKGAKVTIKVNGEEVAQGDIPATVAARFGVDTFGIGEDSGQPVTFDYKPPNKFTGEIEKVEIKLGSDELTPQQRGELEQLEREFDLAIQ